MCHLSHKQKPINSFLATPCYRRFIWRPYREPCFKQRQTKHAKHSWFSQLLSTGTCASSSQKLQFLCSINQNIFISNRSFKTIMNKIPAQSLTFLTFLFIFCINHFIPEQPTEVNNSKMERFILYLQYMNYTNGYSECHQTQKLWEVDGSSPLFHHMLILEA